MLKKALYFVFNTFIVVWISVVSTSCTQEKSTRWEQTAEGKAVIRAEKLIDQRQPQAAVEILQPLVEISEPSYRAVMALASAYVAMSGLEMKDFLDAAEMVLGRLNQDDQALQLIEQRLSRYVEANVAGDDAQKEISNAVLFIQTLDSVLQWLDVLQSVPVPTDATKADSLERAMNVLGRHESALKKGGFLYRALLGISQFRYSWEAGEYFFNLKNCDYRSRAVRADIHYLNQDLSKVLVDFQRSTSNPENQNALSELIQSLSEFELNVETELAEVKPLVDEILEVIGERSSRCD